jgi:SAM-dependent methyltransferase
MIDNEGVLCRSVTTCANCAGPGDIIHTDLRDHLFGSPGTWGTRLCRNRRCGLAWLEPQPLPDQIAKLYETYYTHGTEAERSALENGAAADEIDLSQLVSRGRTRLIKKLLGKLMFWRRFWFDTDFVYLGSRPPGRVLDVGCGAGDYLALLKRAGWDPVGIDFDEKALDMARLRGIDARAGDLVSAAFPHDSFDAVTMMNVIEHLPEPAAVFAECRRILRPGGRLVMMTPNIEALGHRAFGPDWRGLEIPRHLFLYSARTLRAFARRAGFRRVEAFSQLRNRAGAEFMVEQSMMIAASAGRTHPVVDAGEMDRRSSLRAWLGSSRGEWAFLVAER